MSTGNALKLYEITAQFKALERLEDSDEIAQEVILDTLEGLSGDFKQKAIAVAKFIKNLEATADAVAGAVQMMNMREARLRKRAESIRQYLLLHMQITGISRIECAQFQLLIRTNPPAVNIDPLAKLPEQFMVQPPAPPPHPDKRKIKEALLAYEAFGTTQAEVQNPVPGAWLTRGERVEIKY